MFLVKLKNGGWALYKVVGPLHKIRPKVGDGLIQDTGFMQGSLQYTQAFLEPKI